MMCVSRFRVWTDENPLQESSRNPETSSDEEILLTNPYICFTKANKINNYGVLVRCAMQQKLKYKIM